MMTDLIRCAWPTNELAIAYHDTEWGVPLHDDQRHFEFIVLDGAQAGLSWDLILRKRDAYRAAFDGFDPQRVARYTDDKIGELLQNPGIVRNRAKIRAAVTNAQAFLEAQSEFGSFDSFIWQFVDGKPGTNAWRHMAEIPARSAESDAMSFELRRRGFAFVGSTICYAYMQAAGMVNDHTVDCFRYEQCQAEG